MIIVLTYGNWNRKILYRGYCFTLPLRHTYTCSYFVKDVKQPCVFSKLKVTWNLCGLLGIQRHCLNVINVYYVFAQALLDFTDSQVRPGMQDHPEHLGLPVPQGRPGHQAALELLEPLDSPAHLEVLVFQAHKDSKVRSPIPVLSLTSL